MQTSKGSGHPVTQTTVDQHLVSISAPLLVITTPSASSPPRVCASSPQLISATISAMTNTSGLPPLVTSTTLAPAFLAVQSSAEIPSVSSSEVT